MMNDATRGIPSQNSRLIESDSFPFEFVSQLAEIESWRKEIYRPIYHIHKWWANRLGSVFRAILLGSVLPSTANLEKEFYRRHDFSDLIAFDPFMGSGTTIGEAHKLGFIAIGRDINPVACESVRVALGPLNRESLLAAFDQLSFSVGERIRAFYKSNDLEGNRCDVLYFFWVKTVPCPACSSNIDLFSNYIFARNAYPNKKPEVQIYCPNCHDIFSASIKDRQVQCPHCSYTFNPQIGPASGALATCGACNHTFPIAKAIKALEQPPAQRMFAKLIMNSSADKYYLPITKEDEDCYVKCTKELSNKELSLPSLILEDGYNTRQAINYNYKQWRHFFNDRQLLALGMLQQAILSLPDADIRAALLRVFSGTLEFNNMFASYKGEGTGAIRHMFAHHILKPERVPLEGNVWGTPKSSGSFSTLFKSRLLRSIEYRNAPFEIERETKREGTKGRRVYGGSLPFSGQVRTTLPKSSRLTRRAIYISCGSSTNVRLPNASVDLVVTDPPFFDNVHYSELADFFFAWQKMHPSPFNKNISSTRSSEEVQDINAEKFSTKLKAVFSECYRLLNNNGLLVFTYHHSRSEGWISLTNAVIDANFVFVNCQPVKSEMSVAMPKSQAKEPIQIDTIFVCRKREMDTRPQLDFSLALERAIEYSRKKALRLHNAGFNLSLNDRRVILFSQYIVEACPQRSSKDLSNALNENIATLDKSALNLVTNGSDARLRITEYLINEESQKNLFEKPIASNRE